MIFHIASKEDWNAAQDAGEYAPSSLRTEGFIHFSTQRQIAQVAAAFYRGRADLILLSADETKLSAELKWEAPAGPPADNISQDDLFPHLYGALNLDAVISAEEFRA
ncbi:MAG: DUF952 domain-containing protein [Anaerolineales bacterium]|nr:DUF952 domain-containing protein [Anaerolineales bacterium]